MPNIIDVARNRQVRIHPGDSVHNVKRVTFTDNEFALHGEYGFAVFEAQLDEDGNPVIRLVTEPLSADKMLAHELITEAQYDGYVAECAKKDHEKLEQIEFREYLRLAQKYGAADINKAISSCLALYDSLVSLKTGESEPS